MIPDKFSIPKENKVFAFPRDHGSHNDFRIEWWYLVGHLNDAHQNTFSSQLTFFRISARNISNGQILHTYIAHSALLHKGERTFFEERITAQTSDAYCSQSNLDIRFGDWKLVLNDAMTKISMNSSINNKVFLNLNLEVIKSPVIFGKNGVYRKGQTIACSSHYITYPRLRAKGMACVAGHNYEVEGDAWLDHEFGNQYLDENKEGWDWACIQLDTGIEIMAYRLRSLDSSSDKKSNLTWILANGKLKTSNFTWKILNKWKSPHTGIDYPIHIRIDTGTYSFELRPLVEDQERVGSFSGLKYWEGACKVFDSNGKVIGRAFLELAGYAKDLRRALGFHDD